MNRPTIALYLSLFAALALSGCAVHERHPEPIQPAEASASAEYRTYAQATGGVGLQPSGLTGPFNTPDTRSVTNYTQHTFSAVGRDFDPELSPDGQFIAFASTHNSEHPDIYVKSVEGYTMTQITSDPADDIQPRLSPNGDRITFASNRGGTWDIWMVNADGTGLTQLTQTGADEVAPCWSPDGRRVAYTVWGRQSRQWEIWLLDVGKPGVRKFLTFGMFPAFSPDGSRLAFQRARQRGTRWFSVWTVNLEGDEARHPTEIASSPVDACITPTWAPDGSALAFAAVRRAGVAEPTGQPAIGEATADIWVVDVVSGDRRQMTAGSASAYTPNWSPDGRIYFVSAQAGVENIWSLAAQEPGAYAQASALSQFIARNDAGTEQQQDGPSAN